MKRRMISVLLVAGLCLAGLGGCTGGNGKGRTEDARIYVAADGSDGGSGTKSDPFRTLARAQQRVRTLNGDMQGDIRVVVGAGTYPLEETLAFTEADSGTNGYNIIYEADGEVIVDAGKRVTGWTLHDSALNIYKAEYGAPIDTRQLYVEGVHKQRAKDHTVLTGLVNLGADKDGLTTTNLALADYKNQSQIELVYKIMWTAPRCIVSSIEKAGNIAFIEMKQPYWKYANNKMGTSVINVNSAAWLRQPYLENAYEVLDEPGEWYLDTTGAISGTPYTFYYIPEAGQDMSKVTVEIPTLETVMDFAGADVNNTVRNIQFYGITFKNGTYLEPNETGIYDAQNNILREYRPEDCPDPNPMADSGFFFLERMTGGNITMSMAKSIVFRMCTFEQMGNAAIYMNKGCQDNLIEYCHFHNISGQAIQMGEVDMFDTDLYAPKDERLLLKNNDVLNCVIHDVGKDYFSAAAIGATYVQDTDICYNIFENLPYSAIHIGYGWARIRKMGTPKVGNNTIDYNYFNNLIEELYDGGAVYTLGPQYSASMPTYIRNNYIRKQNNFFGAIYLDEGSDHYIVQNTVVEDSPYYFGCNGESTNTVDTMYITRRWTTGNRDVTWFTRADATGKRCVPQNLTFIEEGGTWNAAALKIMNEAGLQPGAVTPCRHTDIGIKYF